MDEFKPLEEAFNQKRNQIQEIMITLNRLTNMQINGNTPKKLVAVF